jgi:hypothetical protein
VVRSATVLLWLAVAILLAAPAAAEDAPATATQPAPESDAIDPEAVEAVRAAAAFLAKAQRVSFRSDIEWDAVQTDGQKIEFGSTRRTLLRRPDHLRVEWDRRDGNRGQLFFDGAQVTVFDADENVYASAAKSGDVDAMLDYLVEQLDYPIALRDILRSDLAERVTRDLEYAQFVGESKLGDTPCDQIALRNDEVDFQVWIAQGKLPVFRRIVVDYPGEEGAPQFRANLSEWSFTPDAADRRFAFEAPAGAEKISFAPRVRRARSEAAP